MKKQGTLYIFLVFSILANAQTIPKSIDKPIKSEVIKTGKGEKSTRAINKSRKFQHVFSFDNGVVSVTR